MSGKFPDRIEGDRQQKQQISRQHVAGDKRGENPVIVDFCHHHMTDLRAFGNLPLDKFTGFGKSDEILRESGVNQPAGTGCQSTAKPAAVLRTVPQPEPDRQHIGTDSGKVNRFADGVIDGGGIDPAEQGDAGQAEAPEQSGTATRGPPGTHVGSKQHQRCEKRRPGKNAE